MKHLFSFLLVILFLAVCAGIYAYLDLQRYAADPLSGPAGETFVTVPPGQGFNKILDTLAGAGVVEDPLRFELVARMGGFDRDIKAGEYRFSSGLSPLEILRMLTEGKVFLHRLTVPEGYTMNQIAGVVEQAGLGTADAFLGLAADPEFVKSRGIHAASLEGYLFPDTYHFPRQVTTEAVVDAMLQRFRKVFTDEWRKRAEEIGMTVHEVVTLASIIEKETGAAVERPVIASVFHNRMDRNMRLQSDPTVIYGIPEFDGNLTRKHLNTTTPYNTYRIGGLPPGPIASPGAAALEATLYPAETKYLYFVSRGDGTHVFSTSLKAHNAAVRKYQLAN